MDAFEHVRSLALTLPLLAKFAIGMAIIVGIPPLSRLCRLPAMVGLLLAGVVIGPHVLDVFGGQTPIAEFFADLGKLLLMFAIGLEIDLALFRKAQNRSILFGLIATAIPLLFGTAVGLLFGYQLIPAIVVGSLFASHTLLGLPIAERLGATRLEPVIVVVGATVVSDTVSLVIFAICISTFVSGFSMFGFVVQLIEIAVFVPLILIGLGRVGAHAMNKLRDDENAHFVLMFGFMAVAGGLAAIIGLPDIVGGVPRRIGGQRFGWRKASKNEAKIHR
jgi:Kef-type K+ transport system membrane component KefB